MSTQLETKLAEKTAEAKTPTDEQTEHYAGWEITTTERHVQVQGRRSPNRFYWMTTVRATHPDGRTLVYTVEAMRHDELESLRARLDAMQQEGAAIEPPPTPLEITQTLPPCPPDKSPVQHIEDEYERMVAAELADIERQRLSQKPYRIRPDLRRKEARRPRKLYIIDEPPNPNCLRCLGERIITYGDEKGLPCPACVTKRWSVIPKRLAA